jgi:DNA polymerase I-like protein with 3'-5' exonuclease and polymerase domains
MVKEKGLHLIDAAPFFERTHKAFLSAPLLLAGTDDNTFVYGFLRDFLLLRNDLRIEAGIVVISCDCREVASEQEIQRVGSLLKKLGVPAVISENNSAVDICHKYVLKATTIYAENDALLQFASRERHIIRRNARSEYEHFDSEAVKRKYGVEPEKKATFLAFTRGQKDSVISRNQAIRLIERLGRLEQIIERMPEIPTLGLRTRIKDNKDVMLSRYQKLVPSANPENRFVGTCEGYSLTLNNKGNAACLNTMGLHSLTRHLKLPDNSGHNYGLVRSQNSDSEIIDNEKALKTLRDRLLETEICAIDTEASSKDPHSATLFGIAFSSGKWNCYIPMLDQDLKGISAKKVLRDIKGVLEDKDRKYIGHNIKYDSVLLRRHGIHLKSIYFDTMLAAFECYGDLEFFNLGFLSEKLLGRGKSPYKEMLGRSDSPWDVPLSKLAEHACEDVEVTFQLFRTLWKEVESKGLAPQFFDQTLPLCHSLGEFEYHGIEVGETELKRYCDNLTEKALKLRQDINATAGRDVNVDSEYELRDLLSSTFGIPLWNKPNKSFIAFLELVASSHEIARLIVQYKRLLKDIHSLEAILNTMKHGRVYPVFSQIKSKAGFVTSTQPDIFAVSHSKDFQSCFDAKLHHFFKDSASAIRRLQALSSDHALRKDMSPNYNVNGFIKSHPLASGKDDVGLLLAFVGGVSDSKIIHQLLIDGQHLKVLRRDVESRYEKLFRFLNKFRRSTLEKGFSEIEGKRKYLAGLKSPNIEKRRKAIEYAVGWLIGYSNH